MSESEAQEFEAKWEVEPGPGGWAVGWFVCSRCGEKNGDQPDICPKCKAIMKKVRF